jgi:hypothetical protein
MTKVAYLIAAHEHPAHLARLAQALASPNTAAFIHLDAKSDIGRFSKVRNAEFLDARLPVYWGDMSLTEASILLLRTALHDPRQFERFVFLSGVDYPIRPQPYIEAFFEAHPDSEFINLCEMPNDEMGKPISRLTQYRLSGRASHSMRRLRRLLVRAKLLSDQRDYKAALGDLKPYGGSSWWALTRPACEYFLDFVTDNPRLFRFFRNTHIPDEGFIHTVLGNSPFRQKVRRGLMITDWTAGGAHPAMINEGHVARYTQPGPLITHDGPYGDGEVLFTRKFNDASGPLVDAIDAANRRAA